MPKRNFTSIKLPQEQPDSCSICPLCGLIPKEQRLKGSKETHVCLGTFEALTGRGIKVKSSLHDSRHPLHRPCDSIWEAWTLLPNRFYNLNSNYYAAYRVPYEQSRQMIIKFHSR